MPFAAFRRHQKKLLAVFAILAMFGFVLADSLPRLLSTNIASGSQNPVVVDLYGKPVRQSALHEMYVQRNNANLFMAMLVGMPNRNFFGETSTRALVDALILQHEADELRMPAGAEAGREWLRQQLGGYMNRELFERTLAQFQRQVTGEQILGDIANQVRLAKVRQRLGAPLVTPLDVYRSYRDQNERISARMAAFPVERYLDKVPEPSSAEVQAYYDKYKDVLPDPARDTPGFKVPRQIRVEILSIDGNALMRGIKDKLTEVELQTYYENRKAEFKQPSAFPDEIFQGAPDLTPPVFQPFAEVRPFLATTLAEDKAQAEIVAKFGAIKDDVLIPFADEYHDALDARAEAEKEGSNTRVAVPTPKDLKDLAKKAGLQHEITPLLDREQAEHYGEIANAEVGLTRLSGGRRFAAEFFEAKSSLFEPVELTDVIGRRYLARKIEDNAPRVPTLDEIRPQVVLDWKTEKARPLAEAAARAYADKVRKDGGTIKEEVVDGRPIIATPPITKLQPGFPIPGQMFQTGPTTMTEIPQIPNPGHDFREAYFHLEPGAVAVAPNQAKTLYYVLTLNQRIEAPFSALYAPNGDYIRYQREAEMEAARHRDEEEMKRLRDQAHLSPDWVPAEEAKKDASKNG